jgi:NTP pyrophosphatase (non-canonical NTP hydrolase)
MDFKQYQEKARKTALYPNVGSNFIYPSLGLGGETGEVLEKIKKVMRDSNGQVTPEIKESLKKEMGDILWYLSALASELGMSLDDIAAANIDKLYSRKDRGKLQGSGDDR